MCGIIAYTGQLSPAEVNQLTRVLVESQIRGRHASGIAWSQDDKIQSIVKPIPMSELLEGFDLLNCYNGDDTCIIAHTRYSTSDLAYNQPIVVDNSAIVHNGVITQLDPTMWEPLYGITCEGKNDSELLLRWIRAGRELESLGGSVAAAYLTIDDGKPHLEVFRNGLRPLWGGKMKDGGRVWASTYSILHRAGVKNITKLLCKDKDLQCRSDYCG